jgi:hypothetical protein
MVTVRFQVHRGYITVIGVYAPVKGKRENSGTFIKNYKTSEYSL